ncbi:MAG: hypothetical protein V4463_17965 [Pseudomonadota bacterium]
MKKLYLLGLALAAMACIPSAYALRPYEGTDASVAEAGVFELEFSPFGYVRGHTQRTLAGPYAVANFGLAGDTELVVEGRINRQQGGVPDGYRTSLGDTALSLKHVFRHGSLQDGGSGISLAAECGVLLPEYHGTSGNGMVCSGIASQKFELATVHLNTAASRTREHTTSHFVGVIVEGAESGALKPVMEIFRDNELGGSQTHSALAGLIWKHSEELSFDLGLRAARADGHPLTELRIGLTWSVAPHQ